MDQGKQIRELRKNLGLTLEKFGNSLGVGKTAISKIEHGENNLTDQMAKAICREYNVNEEWLRNGTGEMFIPRSKNQVITDFLADLIKEDNTFRKDLIEALAELDEDDWEVLAKLAKRLAEKGSAADQENGEKK